MKIALILLSVSLNALAQIFLRHAMRDLHFPLTVPSFMERIFSLGMLGGMLCYAVSIVLWLIVLSRVQVSIAYPFQAFGYVLASLVAWLFLGEGMSVQNIVGLALICLGVIILSLTIV